MLLTGRKLIICFYSYLQDTTKDPNNNKRINSVSMVTKEYQKITMSHLCYTGLKSFPVSVNVFSQQVILHLFFLNMPEGINYKLGGTRFFSFLSPRHRRMQTPQQIFTLILLATEVSLPNFLKISIFPYQMTIDHFCRGYTKKL